MDHIGDLGIQCIGVFHGYRSCAIRQLLRRAAGSRLRRIGAAAQQGGDPNG